MIEEIRMRSAVVSGVAFVALLLAVMLPTVVAFLPAEWSSTVNLEILLFAGVAMALLAFILGLLGFSTRLGKAVTVGSALILTILILVTPFGKSLG